MRRPFNWGSFFVRWVWIWLAVAMLIYFSPDIAKGHFTGLTSSPAYLQQLAHLAAATARFVGWLLIVLFGLDILLELPATLDYVEHRLSDVLHEERGFFSGVTEEILARKISDKAFLAGVTVPVLDEAHANIIEIQTGGTFPHDGTFYTTLRDQVEPLLIAPHIDLIDFHISNKFVTLDNGRQVILSTRTITIDHHSRHVTDVPITLGKELTPIDGLADAELFELQTCRVGDVELKEKLVGPTADPGTGLLKWHLDDTLKHDESGHLRVFRRERVYIPLDEVFDWRATSKPVRAVTLTVDFEDGDAYPHILVYGFPQPNPQFSCRPNEELNHADVAWRGWMLPNHSVVVSYGHTPPPKPDSDA